MNGSSKVISVKGKDIALFKIDNMITALSNSCLHKGGPLAILNQIKGDPSKAISSPQPKNYRSTIKGKN
jgi:nitrite reductase/ring-hydroxylating ferredoxin subunit